MHFFLAGAILSGIENSSSCQREMAVEDAYQLVQAYWSRPDAPERLGVIAFGDGGLAEVEYRRYEEVRHLQRIVPLDRAKAVLELGAGNGRWAVALAPLVGAYIGIDFSQTMVDFARCRAAQAGLSNVTFFRAAVQDYVCAQKFDVIYLSSVSQYLNDDDLSAVVRRLHGLLQPDGTVIERTTIRDWGRLITDQDEYFAIYRTPQELVNLFREAGWSNCYRNPSYHVLHFPPFTRRWVGGRKFARLVGAGAPVSFHLLRAWALSLGRKFERSGRPAEYSHEFLSVQTQRMKRFEPAMFQDGQGTR